MEVYNVLQAADGEFQVPESADSIRVNQPMDKLEPRIRLSKPIY
jgi:hypothetical protein